MNGNAADIVAVCFTLAGVEPGTDFDAKRPYLLGDGTGAADAARWTIEGGEKTVASRVDFMAAKAREVAPDRGVMIVEEIAPAAVAERGGFLSRADDVGKENRGEYPVDRDRRTRAGKIGLGGELDLETLVCKPGRAFRLLGLASRLMPPLRLHGVSNVRPTSWIRPRGPTGV